MRGIWFEAAPDLEVAVSLYRNGPRPLAYASALEDLGRVRVGIGDTQSAVESFEEALTVTTRVGADWDSARIRGRLRRLGVRRRYAVSTRPKTGWAALTEPEINVARLAAEGHTNRADCGCPLCQSAYREYSSPTRLREARDQLESAVDPFRPRAVVLNRSLALDRSARAALFGDPRRGECRPGLRLAAPFC